MNIQKSINKANNRQKRALADRKILTMNTNGTKKQKSHLPMKLVITGLLSIGLSGEKSQNPEAWEVPACFLSASTTFRWTSVSMDLSL